MKYLSVPRFIEAALASGEFADRYRDRLDKVRRRWGERRLTEKPHLWLYAEFYPEHLNAIGTALLADRVAEMIGTAGAARTVPTPVAPESSR